VKRLVQQEDNALALMQRAGLPSVRRLWDANLAHRDIKPANLLVRDGKLYLIDVFFAEIHPSPWRQAVDLANMLLCLALRSSPEQIYQRALQQFTVGEISEAFAAARGLALPSQHRRMMRDQGRDLAAEFVRLLPEPPRPVSIQRWSPRRVELLLLVLLALIPVIDRFPGGCVSYRPEPGIGPSAPLLDQARRAVAFRTRHDLRMALRHRSGGRLALDPEGGN
jgi:hypothetical protein